MFSPENFQGFPPIARESQGDTAGAFSPDMGSLVRRCKATGFALAPGAKDISEGMFRLQGILGTNGLKGDHTVRAVASTVSQHAL